MKIYYFRIREWWKTTLYENSLAHSTEVKSSFGQMCHILENFLTPAWNHWIWIIFLEHLRSRDRKPASSLVENIFSREKSLFFLFLANEPLITTRTLWSRKRSSHFRQQGQTEISCYRSTNSFSGSIFFFLVTRLWGEENSCPFGG